MVRINKPLLLNHLFLLLASIVMIYPVLWLVMSSFKHTHEIFANTNLWPNQWNFNNYVKGWTGFPSTKFSSMFFNSFLICIIVVIGNVFSASLVAFTFARLKFFLHSFWFGIMLLTMMLPSQVTLVPQYILFDALNWVNTYLPLTVPAFLGATPFFIFLMVQFIRGIPRELDEAAIMDGCGSFGIFTKIILPLCGPALITTALFSFLWTWDDFFGQLIYINNVQNYTVPLGLRLFLDSEGKSDWGAMMAMAVISLIPSFILFLTLQKYLVDGIATSGIKG